MQNQLKRERKTPISIKYSAKLFEFDISEISAFCNQQIKNSNLDNKMVEGFEQFHKCFDLYFESASSMEGKVKISENVTLENGTLMHATNRYYGQSWFSNISVVMDNNEIELFDYQTDFGICYAQVCIILCIVEFIKCNFLSIFFF